MKHRDLTAASLAVALSTATAVHRRDHEHPEGQVCRPHVVEVIALGHRSMVVCHDCASDTGFLDGRRAEQVAERHRSMTA